MSLGAVGVFSRVLAGKTGIVVVVLCRNSGQRLCQPASCAVAPPPRAWWVCAYMLFVGVFLLVVGLYKRQRDSPDIHSLENSIRQHSGIHDDEHSTTNFPDVLKEYAADRLRRLVSVPDTVKMVTLMSDSLVAVGSVFDMYEQHVRRRHKSSRHLRPPFHHQPLRTYVGGSCPRPRCLPLLQSPKTRVSTLPTPVQPICPPPTCQPPPPWHQQWGIGGGGEDLVFPESGSVALSPFLVYLHRHCYRLDWRGDHRRRYRSHDILAKEKKQREPAAATREL